MPATPDPAWSVELAKAENDTLRQTADMQGIIAKYNAPTGSVTWTTDAPWGEFNSAVGDTWFPDLTNPDKNTVMGTVVGGFVTLTVAATITALTPFLTQAQFDLLSLRYGNVQRLWQSLSLPQPSREMITLVLQNAPDSILYDDYQKYHVAASIRNKGDLLLSTSLANLQTIDSLLGT
jgi:hypothetical protein